MHYQHHFKPLITYANKRFKGYQQSLNNGKKSLSICLLTDDDGKVISTDFLSSRPISKQCLIIDSYEGKNLPPSLILIAFKKEACPLTFLNMKAIIDTLSITMAHWVKVNSIVRMWIVTLDCPDLFSFFMQHYCINIKLIQYYEKKRKQANRNVLCS